MGRPKEISTGMFRVPDAKKSISRRPKIPITLTEERFLKVAEPKSKKDAFVIPEVKLGRGRDHLLKKLLERGRVRKSEFSFKDLQLKKCFPKLVHVEVDCMDEAELRSRFPKQGINHAFFRSGDYKFEFLLPSESDTVVVAQVLDNSKVRMPLD